MSLRSVPLRLCEFQDYLGRTTLFSFLAALPLSPRRFQDGSR